MNAEMIHYVAKLKTAGWSDERIALKIGMQISDLKVEWDKAIIQGEQMMASGYVALCDQFRILCCQYELMGESLKVFSAALSNGVTEGELKEAGFTKEADSLLKRYIMLKPFVVQDPQVALEQSLSKN